MTIKVIAEIGINHKGSETRVKKIIDIANESKAWGIKFQYRGIKNFYATKNEIGDEILSNEIERSNLEFSNIIKFTKYAKKLSLRVGISFFRTEDLVKKKKYLKYFDFLKIPSAEFENDDLINLAKKSNKDVFISTGGNNENKILDKIKKLNKKKFVVFHCISNYPTITGFQQLSFLNKLNKIKNLRIGYSSHDKDWEINLIAMSLGINFIERHLTINKSENGLDESSSSEKKDFKKICYFANNYKNILGKGKRIANQGEIINMQNLGTSFYAKKNLIKNSKISLKDIELKAPRLGLTKLDLKKFKSLKILNTVKKNQPLLISTFKSSKFKFTEKKIQFLVKNKISIPFRLHDSEMIHKLFPCKYNEWHLSFGEILKFNNKFFNPEEIIYKDREYTLHLPDYIKNNKLIDPISDNKLIRNESIRVIKTTINLSNKISDITKKNVKIVGSFSRIHENKIKTLDRVFNFLESFSGDNYKLLPQWLPKIAWYFGGAEKQNLFCDTEDIDYILKNNKRICLDVSHLILSANYENINWRNWYNKLIKITEHIHLSDAKGIDGEGINFGEGDLNKIDFILNNKNVKVLEVWQGHLENGKKFYNAINKLYYEYS